MCPGSTVRVPPYGPIWEVRRGHSRRGPQGLGHWGVRSSPTISVPVLGVQTSCWVGRGDMKKKQAWDLSVPQRSRGTWQAGRGDPTERPGWLLSGAGTVERLLEGKTGLWVAGRAWWGAARWQGWKPAPSTCVGCRSWAPCNPWPGASLVEPSPSSPPPSPGSASPSAQRARAPGTCLSVEV